MRTLCCLLLSFTATAAAGYEIAFTSFAPLDTDLFIADADGSNAKPFLAHTDLDSNASFSRDGRWVVFTSRRDGSSDIHRAHPDGSGLEVLVAGPAYDDQAALSPDGRNLAFVSSRGGQTDIWVLDLKSRRTTNLTNHRAGDFRPQWSPDGKWIAFSSDRDSTFPRDTGGFAVRQPLEIYVMRADGSEPRRVTSDSRVIGSPAWSPDGKRLAVYATSLAEYYKINGARRERGTTQIELIDIASGTREIVTSGSGEKWSPRWLDATRVGYVSRPPEGGLEFTRGAPGARGDFRAPSWSADGRRVVFHREVSSAWPPNRSWPSLDPQFALRRVGVFPAYSPRGDRFVQNDGVTGILSRGILIANGNGSESRMLFTEETRNSVSPDWSRSGDRIAFGLGRFFPMIQSAPLADIAVVNSDGSGFELLTDGKANLGFPAWSPDARSLVIRRSAPGQNALEILDVATKQRRELIGGKAHFNFPAWSPDGSRISFTSDIDGDYEIYSIRPDGSDRVRLTNAPWNDAHSRWSPDGEWLVFTTGRGYYKDEAALHIGNPQAYGEIAVMRADGSDVRVLTDDQFEDGTPTWIR